MAFRDHESQTMDDEHSLELGTVREARHLEQIKKLMQAQKLPAAIRNHSALADQNANPIYSVSEVEQICQYLSTKYRLFPQPRAGGPIRPRSMLAQAPMVATEHTEARVSSAFRPILRQSPVSNGIGQLHLVQHDASNEPLANFADLTPPSSRAASVGSLSFLQPAPLQIWSPDVQGKILVKSQSFDAIMAELQAKSAFKDKGELLLFFCKPSSEGQQPLWVDSEEIFQMMLLETDGQWEVRLKPKTPLQPVESIRQDTGVSRQLTYDSREPLEITAERHPTSLAAAQAQTKYAHTIRSQLKEIVADALNEFDQKMLAPVLVDSALPELFRDKLRQAQAEDPQLTDIKAQLESITRPPPELRLLYSIVDNLVVVAEGDRRQRIVVPEGPLRSEICKFFHEKNGHPDVHRIINAVTSYFFWPSMHKEIRAFVGSCPACQAAKAKSRLPGCYSEPLHCPGAPGSHWILYFIDLPESANGFSQLSVFSDQLS